MLLGALRFDFLSYLKKHFFPPLVSSNKQSTPRKFKYSTYKASEKEYKACAQGHSSQKNDRFN